MKIKIEFYDLGGILIYFPAPETMSFVIDLKAFRSALKMLKCKNILADPRFVETYLGFVDDMAEKGTAVLRHDGQYGPPFLEYDALAATLEVLKQPIVVQPTD